MNKYRYRNEIYLKLRTFYEVFDQSKLGDLEELTKGITFVQKHGFAELNAELDHKYGQTIILEKINSFSEYPPPDPLVAVCNYYHAVLDNFYDKHPRNRPQVIEPLVMYCMHRGIDPFEEKKLKPRYFDGLNPGIKNVEGWRNEIYRSLQSYYEETDPGLLKFPDKMCRIISYVQKLGYDGLNELLRKKYGSEIELKHTSFKRVPFPGPKVVLRNRLYAELTQFYGRHESTKPEEFDPIVEYIVEKGKAKFEAKLMAKYGEGLSHRKIDSIYDLTLDDV